LAPRAQAGGLAIDPRVRGVGVPSTKGTLRDDPANRPDVIANRRLRDGQTCAASRRRPTFRARSEASVDVNVLANAVPHPLRRCAVVLPGVSAAYRPLHVRIWKAARALRYRCARSRRVE
jgi:hypothetical protein